MQYLITRQHMWASAYYVPLYTMLRCLWNCLIMLSKLLHMLLSCLCPMTAHAEFVVSDQWFTVTSLLVDTLLSPMHCDITIGGHFTGQRCDITIGRHFTGQRCDITIGRHFTGQRCDITIGRHFTGQRCTATSLLVDILLVNDALRHHYW